MVGAAVGCGLGITYSFYQNFFGRAYTSHRNEGNGNGQTKLLLRSSGLDPIFGSHLTGDLCSNTCSSHCRFLWAVAASSPLSRGLRIAMIDSSAKAPALSKFDPKAVPDQRVSAITPASVRFFKGTNPSDCILMDYYQTIMTFYLLLFTYVLEV